MSDFGNYIKPKARKEHQCIACAGPIPVGERHVRYVGKWEGEFQDWRMHNECNVDYEKDATNYDHIIYPGESPMPERIKQLCAVRRTLKQLALKAVENVG